MKLLIPRNYIPKVNSSTNSIYGTFSSKEGGSDGKEGGSDGHEGIINYSSPIKKNNYRKKKSIFV